MAVNIFLSWLWLCGLKIIRILIGTIFIFGTIFFGTNNNWDTHESHDKIFFRDFEPYLNCITSIQVRYGMIFYIETGTMATPLSTLHHPKGLTQKATSDSIEVSTKCILGHSVLAAYCLNIEYVVLSVTIDWCSVTCLSEWRITTVFQLIQPDNKTVLWI